MNVKFIIKVMSGKNKKAINTAIIKKWNIAIIRASVNVEAILKSALINEGSFGIKPFTQTDLWQFLMLPETLAELGFMTTAPLTEDLLDSILSTIVVKTLGTTKKRMVIRVFDMQYVANATIHRSAGTGQLGDVSWFVDWIIKGVPVTDYKFKETGPPKPRSSQLAGSKAGLMVKGGLWQFPPRFRDAVDVWLEDNQAPIQKLVENTIRFHIGRA